MVLLTREAEALPSYQIAPSNGYNLSSTPPIPGDSQRPHDVRSTILQARKHPHAEQVVKKVNAYFLEKWPFKTDKHRKRFVEEGYGWFVCVNCPLSLDDRMHWGCKLLTAGFLVDDVLDHMSVEEGVLHNTSVIECASGTRLPDPQNAAEVILHDLFESMRAVDTVLADELLVPTIDFFQAQADGGRMKPMTLGEYFEYRDADLGKGLLSGIMRFCARLYMTPEELELVKPVEENAMKHITFVNDVCSYDKEVLAARKGFDLGAMCSSVPIMMDLFGLDEQRAKHLMWQTAREWEIRHFELVEDVLRKNSSPNMIRYLKGLEHQMAGNEVWSLLTPRYNRTTSMAFSDGRQGLKNRLVIGFG
ncbi:terpenoid synthase [Xylariaceae sp. FL1272]|nr:terpenoid synthase [Xylariaceae sp. FL1272]